MNTGLTNNIYALNVLSLAINGNNIFAGTRAGVYLSSNNGGNWTAVNTGLTDTTVNSLIIDGSNIFAGTGDGSSNNGGIFLSSNNGSSWTAVNSGLPNYAYINTFAIKGSDIFAGTSVGVYLSSNNGSSWTITGIASFGITSLAISGNNIFAGAAGGNHYVYWSSNNANSWTTTGSIGEVYPLAINGSYIFAGIFLGGVWRLPLSELGIAEINNKASIIEVYPNPSINILTIEVPKDAAIEIRNIQGQLIKTYASSGKTNINVSAFPSGVYIVEVKMEQGIIVRKFIKE